MRVGGAGGLEDLAQEELGSILLRICEEVLGRPDLDVDVARLALVAGVLTRHPDTTHAVAIALGHPNREIRMAAVQPATRLAGKPEVRAALEELAASETDPEVRSEISAALTHAKPFAR